MAPNCPLLMRRLLVTAAILQLLPHAASGAVGFGVRGAQSRGDANPGVLDLQAPAAPAAGIQPGARSGNSNPGVHPPNSKPYGLSYGEWSAKWWQWILQIPAATNPNLDATGGHCAEGQSGHVWFLAGSFGTLPSPIFRNCTIPAGKSLLIPILNQADGAGLIDCAGPAPFDVPCAAFVFNGKTGLAALREEAKVSQDNPALLQLSLDGVTLSDLSAYRAQSPVFSYPLTTGNVISLLLSLSGCPVRKLPARTHPLCRTAIGSCLHHCLRARMLSIPKAYRPAVLRPVA